MTPERISEPTYYNWTAKFGGLAVSDVQKLKGLGEENGALWNQVKYRRLIAQKFDGSKYRRSIGRPPLARDVVNLVIRMARENPGWGYDRIVGALSSLVYAVCDQTVGNVLRRQSIAPAPKRSQTTTWKDSSRRR